MIEIGLRKNIPAFHSTSTAQRIYIKVGMGCVNGGGVMR